MSGKACLITGATSGIGRATAIALGRLGWDLWLVGRDARRGEEVVRTVEKLGKGGRASFVRTDVSSLAEVRALAARFRQEAGRIDVLVNNAGARYLRAGRSTEGIEHTFATNHLGHFLLTLLLVDLLAESEGGRVVNVASSAHHAGRGEYEAVLGQEPYDGRRAYAESKLANVLFTVELSRRLRGTTITVNAADPGGVATRFSRNNGLLRWLWHCLYYAKQRSLLTAGQGCQTGVYLASSEDAAGISGSYFHNMEPAPMSTVAHDNELARQLWNLSIKLSGVTPSDMPAPWAKRLMSEKAALDPS